MEFNKEKIIVGERIMDNIVIRFHGMKTVTQPKVLKDFLETLLRYAPSKSICHLHIFKEEYSYLCKLTVHSNIKTFSSNFQHENLQHTIKIVLKSVKKQMALWKKNRSTEDLTGIISVALLDLDSLNIIVEENTNSQTSSNKESA